LKQITFKSFLSHRYKSADVNLYFFDLFNEVAEIQFEVDEGMFSTNVTRLERMVRDADAFIGIYPFSDFNNDNSLLDELKKQSRYFRLEIDLAIRSQKPTIIFYDKRYGNLIKPPENIFSYPFDFNEVSGTGGFPSLNKHKEEFIRFCKTVERKKLYDDIQIAKGKSIVAIVISKDTRDETVIRKLFEILNSYNYSEIEVIELPTSLETNLFRILEKIDFAIVDYCEYVSSSGIAAYFHGRYIPMIRIECNKLSDANNLESFLFGSLEIGYKKDKIIWDNEDTLYTELSKKLQIINSQVKRINTYDEAKVYFQSAILRKEVVFVSYSGEDIEIAKDIIFELKNNFQTVFDYRDGKSIVPGQPWLSEIFDTLAKSAIGINLLSNSYFKSGNCMHEAEQMVANKDNGNLKLFPIKLYNEQIALPNFFGATQYVRKIDYESIKGLVSEIIKLSLL
jgi:hypothetical protein